MPESAFGESVLQAGEARVQARLLVHPDARGGARYAGVLLEMDPGWHIYWRDPGESGLPTEIEWVGKGIAAEPLSWPAPTLYRESDGLFTTYGYSDQVLLFARLALPSQLGELGVRVQLLACKVECVPGEFELSRLLLPESEADAAATRALFDHFAARLPVSPASVGARVDAVLSQSAIRPGDAFELALRVHCLEGEAEAALLCSEMEASAEAGEFFPVGLGDLELSAKGVRRSSEGGAFALVFAGSSYAGEDAQLPERLEGVLRFPNSEGGHLALEFSAPLPRAAAGAAVEELGSEWFAAAPTFSEAASVAEARAAVGLWQVLGLAFLGGLLLNLMPCVLPVLAIKIFAVAEMAQHGRRELVGHAAAYTGGILITLLGLAAVVIGLRTAGTAVGWGFQFQEPIFVAVVTLIVVSFGLNLFGVFEVNFNPGALGQVGQQAVGLRRSFFDGLLGVILATPCSAPFLGTAVGFAFASSAPVILGVFACIGLGLASPFVLVSFVPSAAGWMPRSGAWMLRFRAGLGFALMGTAVWLLWVYGRACGLDAMVALAGFLVLLAFGLWIYGLCQASFQIRLSRIVAAGLLAGVLLGLPALPRGEGAAASETQAKAWASPFDAKSVRASVEAGQPTFVYFTADWCITCKVNERLVLSDDRVRDELARLGFAAFRGDWTRRDEAIRVELARFGKAGVPLYLVYAPGAPDDPVLLPEVLTVDLLIEALTDASEGTREQPPNRFASG